MLSHDHKITAILDFLVNGLEHGSDAEARRYLCEEFGIGYNLAVSLVDAGLDYLAQGPRAEPLLVLRVQAILG